MQLTLCEVEVDVIFFLVVEAKMKNNTQKKSVRCPNQATLNVRRCFTPKIESLAEFHRSFRSPCFVQLA